MPRKLSSETRAKNSERAVEWNRTRLHRYLLSLRNDTESDMIEWMDAQPSKQAYIKSLIKKDMKEFKMKNFTGTIHSEKGFLIGDPANAIESGALRAACTSNGFMSGEYSIGGHAFMFVSCDDGTYRDSTGWNTCDIDSGSLGLIPIELCTKECEYQIEYGGHIFECPGDARYSVTCAPKRAPVGDYTTTLTISLPNGQEIKYTI